MSNNKQTKKERRGWPFSGGCSFYIKNKLKSEILNGKKFIKMFFSKKFCNQDFTLGLLKDGMELRMSNFNIMRVHWKIWFLGGCMKNQYIECEIAKLGGLDSLQI